MSVISVKSVLVAAMLVGIGSACGGDGPTRPSGPASLTVVPGGDVRLFGIGSTAQLTATPKDSDGNPVSAQVTWTSDNQSIATVSGTGLVTATGIGTTKVRAATGGVVQEVVVVVQPAQFNVNANDACFNPDMRSFDIQAQSEHLIIVSSTDNPAGGLTAQDYAAFAASFERLVWPVVTGNFGLPADIDGNGKVIAFFTRAVNELTPAGSESIVGGFFFGRDLFPKAGSQRLQACPGSNEAEMFYLLVPDPNGVVNNNVRTVETVRRLSLGVIGHELQHLINSSRRLFINQAAIWPETSYMEEGLSHIAEEMLFYEASAGLLPRMNVGIDAIKNSQAALDAFNMYMGSNASRFSRYLKEPSGNAPYQKDDDLETRGAIWSFLRYLADRGTPGTAAVETTCANPVVLGAGGRCRIDGPAAAQFGVAAGANLGEFTIVAFAADLPTVAGPPIQSGSLTTNASATASIAVTGPPTPWTTAGGAQLSTFGMASLGPAGGAQLTLDHSFHSRLRAMERRDLRDRVAGARAVYAGRRALASSPRMYSATGSTPLLAATVVEAVWAQLVNSNDTGMVNLKGRFGQDITGAARDWAVANYVDDIGIPVPTQYTHPSWNFRSLLPALTANNKVYPLQVRDLAGGPFTVTMVDGGAAYYRLGVAAGATSTVRFSVGGAAPPANLKLVLVRTK